MRKEPTINLGKYNAVTNHCIDPILLVLKWQIQDKPTTLCKIFLQLIVYQVKNILFIDCLAQCKVLNDAFLDGSQPTNEITVLVCLWWILLKELHTLKYLINHALYTNVNNV